MKLKQKLALGLCTFYLLSVIGVALSIHFCGGKLASVTVFSATGCNLCKTEPADKKDDGCCKNTKVEVKIKDNHSATSELKLPKVVGFEALLAIPPFNGIKKILSFFSGKIAYKVPPSSTRVALHVLNCVFRN